MIYISEELHCNKFKKLPVLKISLTGMDGRHCSNELPVEYRVKLTTYSDYGDFPSVPPPYDSVMNRFNKCYFYNYYLVKYAPTLSKRSRGIVCEAMNKPDDMRVVVKHI